MSGKEIVMTKAQEKQHDREYRVWLINKGLLKPVKKNESA